MYRLEEGQAYFLEEGSWVHEMFSDWVYGFKHETMFDMWEGKDSREY